MQVRLAAPLTFDSIVDGPGLRTVIWTQGCPHLCPGCHNPQTHDMKAGFMMNTEEIIKQIKATKLQKGVTLSGGEPFLQSEALIEIAKEVKKLGMDVWAYTGFRYEFLINEKNPNYEHNIRLLQYVDTLVDGRFMEQLKSVHLLFRGSSNQRIINVQQSLLQQEVVCFEEYM
ncbi:MAG: anaerobic ribonucleoside-triphosphate reductase activating protein [Bacillus sp. (in: firmicutes)]